MKKIILICSMFIAITGAAEEKIQFNFLNEEITKIAELYSKATGTKFVIDSTVRGKITILNSNPISTNEAYNQFSEGLKLNGFAIVKKDDYSTIRNARSAQRDGVEISNTLPALRPERVATWIVTLKNISADEVQHRLGRMMTSMYGEIESVPSKNQIILTDFTSSLDRMASIIKEIDQPADPKLAKIIEQNKLNEKKKIDASTKKKTDEEK
jgi:type II secretory pathway component GspD/PulD (secretin)